MKRQPIPHTPLSTPLSGSAKEVELRLNHIFSGPKKRPPVLFLVLMFSVCIFCGNLVSCHNAEPETPDVSAASGEDALVQALFLAAEEEKPFQLPETQLLASAEGEGCDLAVVGVTDHLENSLLIGVVDRETGELSGPLFRADCRSNGVPEAVTYQQDSDTYLLYVLNSQDITESGEAGLVRFDGETLSWDWPVSGNLLQDRTVQDAYQDYWTDHLARMAPNGVDVYYANRHFTLGTDDPESLWILDKSIPFFTAPADIPGLSPDLNHNGVPEQVILVEHNYSASTDWSVEFWEGDELIKRESPDVCLCTLDGKDYILRPSAYIEQGVYDYYYTLSDLSGEFEEWVQSGEVHFDTNFETLYHKGFDPQAIAAYVDELNELLGHSVQLTQAGSELRAREPELETIACLDAFPEVYTRDRSKSLLQNLQDFRAVMPQPMEPPAADGIMLLSDQPIELEFCSGAGAWQTVLTLHGDGSFTGDYCDADMNIHYVCQFHGRFGNIVHLSGASFYMTLEELVLDTPYPVGKEWDEGDIHNISSEPYGFTGADGKALQPGAGFVFYLPEATGHAPGTELYGATEFCTWWPNRHGFGSASDTLGRCGLHNLETGYGFFS